MKTETLSKQENKFSSQTEVISSLQYYVGENIGRFLKPVHESWQPSDYLPDLASESWMDQITQLRVTAQRLPDDILVALVGDMITEEALPSYQTWLNGLVGVSDSTGISDHPLAQWSRGWTAEENRHGDLLNRYLYLTGRVDMKAIEITIQHLIRNGFNPKTENDPYQGFIYTSFQERATNISHRNVSILASRLEERKLQDICGIIAGDEARHERAYSSFMQYIFNADPSGAMIAFSKMMKKNITMPGSLMELGENSSLFTHFAHVAQRIGVYTAQDYTSIIAHLIKTWNVEHLEGLSASAAEAQDYVCSLPQRFKRVAERKTVSNVKYKFSWIYNRDA